MVRTVIKSVLAVALLLVIVQLAYWLAVRRYFVSLAEAVEPVAQLHFDRVVAFPPGQFGLDGLRFEVDGRADLTLRADRLRVRSTDLDWLLRWLWGAQANAPAGIALDLDGVAGSAAFTRQLRERVDALGLVLPFEGVGCADDSATLTDADYDALGWNDGRFDLQVDLEHDRGSRELRMVARLDRRPAGALRVNLAFVDVADSGLRLTADLGGARLDRIELDYDEQGLLARRDVHCAEASGIGMDAFVARHRERVHDWLGSKGLVPDEPVWAAYGRWLDAGGALSLVATPAPGVPFSEYAQFAPEDRLRLLGISARVGAGEPVPVEATSTRQARADFRALPPLSDIDPLHAFDPAADRLDAGVEGDPGGESIDPGEDTPRAAVPATVPPTSPQAADTRRSAPIAFPELAMHLGQRVRISTVGGNRHVGVVLDATADAMELEIRRYGGGARLPIARDQISRIDLLASDRPDG